MTINLRKNILFQGIYSVLLNYKIQFRKSAINSKLLVVNSNCKLVKDIIYSNLVAVLQFPVILKQCLSLIIGSIHISDEMLSFPGREKKLEIVF